MKPTLGDLIKEARTKAGYTQEELAKKVGMGLDASDISKAERGVGELTKEQIKQIARETGVTQKSLLEAAGQTTAKSSKTSSSKTSSAAKTSGSKTSSSKTSGSKTADSKKTTSSKTTAKKTSESKKNTKAKEDGPVKTETDEYTMTVTAAERRLVELFRKADADSKRSAVNVLRGTAGAAGETFGDLLKN